MLVTQERPPLSSLSCLARFGISARASTKLYGGAEALPTPLACPHLPPGASFRGQDKTSAPVRRNTNAVQPRLVSLSSGRASKRATQPQSAAERAARSCKRLTGLSAKNCSPVTWRDAAARSVGRLAEAAPCFSELRQATASAQRRVQFHLCERSVRHSTLLFLRVTPACFVRVYGIHLAYAFDDCGDPCRAVLPSLPL